MLSSVYFPSFSSPNEEATADVSAVSASAAPQIVGFQKTEPSELTAVRLYKRHGMSGYSRPHAPCVLQLNGIDKRG